MDRRNRGSGPVAAIRIAAGFTQTSAAAAMGYAQSYLARIEGGYVDPGTSRVAKMAKIYGVPIEVMVTAIEKAQRARARRGVAA